MRQELLQSNLRKYASSDLIWAHLWHWPTLTLYSSICKIGPLCTNCRLTLFLPDKSVQSNFNTCTTRLIPIIRLQFVARWNDFNVAADCRFKRTTMPVQYCAFTMSVVSVYYNYYVSSIYRPCRLCYFFCAVFCSSHFAHFSQASYSWLPFICSRIFHIVEAERQSSYDFAFVNSHNNAPQIISACPSYNIRPETWLTAIFCLTRSKNHGIKMKQFYILSILSVFCCAFACRNFSYSSDVS